MHSLTLKVHSACAHESGESLVLASL